RDRDSLTAIHLLSGHHCAETDRWVQFAARGTRYDADAHAWLGSPAGGIVLPVLRRIAEPVCGRGSGTTRDLMRQMEPEHTACALFCAEVCRQISARRR